MGARSGLLGDEDLAEAAEALEPGNDSGAMVGVYTTKESGQDAFDFHAEEDSLDPTARGSHPFSAHSRRPSAIACWNLV